MLHCIVGALLACSSSAAVHIPGKLAYAPAVHSQAAWNYAATYQVPTLGQPPLMFPRYRT